MFKKRNISEEEALKRACKQNDFEFVPNNNKPQKTISVNDECKETMNDDELNVETVKLKDVISIIKAIRSNYDEDFLDDDCELSTDYTEGAYDVCNLIIAKLKRKYCL